VETSFIEVLQVKGQGARKTRERVRWVDTRKLEVQKPVRGPGQRRQIPLKPELDRIVSRLVDCVGRKASSPEWSREDHKVLVHRYVGHVCRTFFRALPVEATVRVAVREALRRLPSEGGPKGIPVFEGDATDAYGGALGPDPSPIVSEADLVHFGVTNPRRLGPRFRGDPSGASNLDWSVSTEAVPAVQRATSRR
jgi:hypothetical protein